VIVGVAATEGSYYDRMTAGIELSEKKRRAATARGDRVRAQVRREFEIRDLSNRTLTPESEIQANADWRADTDKIVGAHVAGEQWGHRLTVMYGVAHLAGAVEMMQDQLDNVIRRQDETNALLRRIADALEATYRTT